MEHQDLNTNRNPKRYLKKRLAGQGCRAQVFEALDQRLGRVVALKEALHPAERALIVEEAERLARVRSPHIVQVYDLDLDEQPRLVLEWLEGQTLRQAMTQDRRAVLEGVLPMWNQFLTGLCSVHQAGIIHGDLKPENVWLRKDGEVVLFDFGSSPTAGGDATVLYAAPEILAGSAPSPRADMYSAGCLLFEILCGTPPYDGVDAAELATRKHNRPAPSPRERGGECSAQVETWLRRCLKPQADDRFESAEDALESWRRLSEFAKPVALTDSTEFDLHPDVSGPLQRLLNEPALGKGITLTLAGSRGFGKSTLIRQLAATQNQRSRWTLVLQDHSANGALGNSWNAAVDAQLDPKQTQAPRLDPKTPLGTENEFGQVEQFFLEQQGVHGPVLLVDMLEDCDATTQRLLVQLARRADLLGLSIIVCSNDQQHNPSTRKSWCDILDSAQQCFRLQRPTREKIRELVAHRLGVPEVSASLSSYVYSRSGGNPRYVALLVDELKAQDALLFSGDAWIFKAEKTTNAAPANAIPHLRNQLANLSSREVCLLQEAAVHGNGFVSKHLAITSQHTVDEIEKQLFSIEKKTDLLLHENSAFRFQEPLLLEYLYDQVDPNRRTEIHQTLAKLLLGEEAQDRTAIGIHLFRAGDEAASLPHLIQAGRDALEQRNAMAARRIFDFAVKVIALDAQDEAAAEQQVTVLHLHAQALRLDAAWDEAVLQLERGSTLAQAWGLPKAEVSALRALGEIEYARGDFNAAIQRYEAGMAAAQRQGDQQEAQEIELQIGNIHFERGELDEAFIAYSTVLEYATVEENVDLEARSSHNLALVESSLGRKDSAIELFGRSLSLFRALGRNDAVARIHHNIGMAYLELKNWAEARNYFERCIKLADESLRAISYLDLAEAAIQLGQTQTALQSIQRALAICRERDDRLGIATAYRLQGQLAAHHKDFATATGHLEQSIDLLKELGDTPHLALALKELGRIYLDSTQSQKAVKVLSEARQLFSDSETTHEVAAEIEKLWIKCKEEINCRP